jgi:hypothetical protein
MGKDISLTKEQTLEYLNCYRYRRWSVFINNKRFIYKKAVLYIKNNISDNCTFLIHEYHQLLPWWLGDWEYYKNSYSPYGKMKRLCRKNIRITIK